MVKNFSQFGYPGPASNLRLQITASCWATPSEMLRSLPAYQKMRLKRVARICESPVKIGQGISGIRNPGIPGKR